MFKVTGRPVDTYTDTFPAKDGRPALTSVKLQVLVSVVKYQSRRTNVVDISLYGDPDACIKRAENYISAGKAITLDITVTARNNNLYINELDTQNNLKKS